MKDLLFASTLLVATLLGCAKSTDPVEGSQTHFLQSCDESCPAPYDCICGVCTIACEEDATCGGQADDAQCIAPLSASCSALASVCDVSCEDDDECASLGAGFECRDGRCREDQGAPPVDAGTDADVPPERGRLCDGSTDMRLGYTSEGGAVEVTYELTNPYGHAFLFIDGECRYYVSTSHRDGLRVGTLTPSQRDDLEREVEWDVIEELAGEVDEESCPDAGEVSIWAPGNKVACTCGCEETAVGTRKAAALQHISELMTALMSEGSPATTPVLAVASPNDGIVDASAWPLDRPIGEVPSLVHDVFAEAVESFAVFDRNVDIAALRALRMATQVGRLVAVSDAGGTYELHMRDAFPPGVQARIDALRGIDKPIDPEMGELCDGSDDIRLGLTTPVEQGRSFIGITQPYYGSAFLYVDGHCNYYLSRYYVEGIGSGVIGAQDAASLQSAIQWQALGRMALAPDMFSGCSDFVPAVIRSPRANASCDCECDGPYAEQLAGAIDQLDYWISSALWPGSLEIAAPVRVIATMIDGEPSGTSLMWPLDQPLAEYEGLVSLDGASGSGLIFDDPDDVAALRDVRRSQAVDDYGLTLQDGQAVYQVHIVDQLPADVAAAVNRFRDGNP